MRHVHLDPLGGIAGDMFAAALLHAHPDGLAAVTQAVAAVAGAGCQLVPHTDGTLSGVRFIVTEDAGHHHHHAYWADIVPGSGGPASLPRSGVTRWASSAGGPRAGARAP